MLLQKSFRNLYICIFLQFWNFNISCDIVIRKINNNKFTAHDNNIRSQEFRAYFSMMYNVNIPFFIYIILYVFVVRAAWEILIIVLSDYRRDIKNGE